MFKSAWLLQQKLGLPPPRLPTSRHCSHATPSASPSSPLPWQMAPGTLCELLLGTCLSNQGYTAPSAESKTSPPGMLASGHLGKLLRACLPRKGCTVSATDSEIPHPQPLVPGAPHDSQKETTMPRVPLPHPKSMGQRTPMNTGSGTSKVICRVTLPPTRVTQHQPESYLLSLRP